MELYIAKSDQQIGPFSEEVVRSMLSSGMIQLTDPVWHDGLPDWQPLHVLLRLPPPMPPSLPQDNTGGATHGYISYNDVPFYRRQWFFWVTYFTVTPVALGLLLFGDIYYQKRGEVASFGMANRIVAGFFGMVWLHKVFAVV